MINIVVQYHNVYVCLVILLCKNLASTGCMWASSNKYLGGTYHSCLPVPLSLKATLHIQNDTPHKLTQLPPSSAQQQDIAQRRLYRKPFRPHKVANTGSNRSRMAPKELSQADSEMINNIIDKQRLVIAGKLLIILIAL